MGNTTDDALKEGVVLQAPRFPGIYSEVLVPKIKNISSCGRAPLIATILYEDCDCLDIIGGMETNRLAVGLALRLPFGAAFGLLLDNIGLGIGLGLIFGVCVSAINWGNNDRDENSTED